MVTDVTSLRNQLTEYQQEYRKTITQILPVDRIYVTFLDIYNNQQNICPLGTISKMGCIMGSKANLFYMICKRIESTQSKLSQ